MPERVDWKEIAPGYQSARLLIDADGAMLPIEFLVLRFDPGRYQLQVAIASDFGFERTTIKYLTTQLDGVAGINANFFDTKNHALGLVIHAGVERNPVHRGGNLLTGVFYLENDVPHIRGRSDGPTSSVPTAIQSGPRLIIDGKPTSVAGDDRATRRSGIAITQQGEVILYATVVRFPGATLSQTQRLLMNPSLGVRDALNLDGGSSSQIFVARQESRQDEVFITGNGLVPIGLIVKQKTTSTLADAKN